jgi:hypothetical protein
VLHGGGSRGDIMHVNPTQLSVLRMIPTARRVARQGGRRLAVLRLLNSYRGWDSNHTPVDDVRWAVDELLRRFPGRSLGLVGHSLGGRAANARRGRARGRGRRPEPMAPPGRATHADPGAGPGRARVAGPGGPASRSVAFVERLSATTRASYLALADGKHAMLRSGRRFDRYAAEFTAAVLLGDAPSVSDPVARALEVRVRKSTRLAVEARRVVVGA